MFKYISLLTGSGNINDPDCRRFLSLFIDEKNKDARRALISGRYTHEQKTVIFTTLSNLVHTCSFYDLEELNNETKLVLLTLASRYKDKGRGFTGYVNGAYFYELGRKIKELIQDPIVFQKDNLVSYSDVIYSDPDSEVDDTDILDRIDNLIMEDEENELNNSWIQGVTCSDVFNKLTPLERLILKYKYNDKLTDAQIGDRIGYHPDTVRKKRVKAREIIRKELYSNGADLNGKQ